MESTVKALVLLIAEGFVAASVVVALTLCAPCPSGTPCTQLKLPAAVATAVQATTPSTRTVTVLPASAVPVYVGVVVLGRLPFAGATTTGAAGAMLSTVNALVL